MSGELIHVSGAEEVDWAFASLNTSGDSFRRAMVAASNEVRIAMRREVARKFRKGKGFLERSVGYKIVKTMTGIESWIKPRAFYAGTLESGKTISAKNAPFLRFPYLIGSSGGATIYKRWKSTAQKYADRANARSHRNTKSYQNYLLGVRGSAEDRATLKTGEAKLAWKRVKSVTIKPHPFVEPTARESESAVADILGSGFVAAFARTK